MSGFVFTYLSTRGLGDGEWATPHCKRQNVPSSQLTTKFARDEADKAKETSSSDKTGTTPLGRKHRARILPLSVTGHTRNRVPEIMRRKCQENNRLQNSLYFSVLVKNKRVVKQKSCYEGENGLGRDSLAPHAEARSLRALKTDFEKTKPPGFFRPECTEIAPRQSESVVE